MFVIGDMKVSVLLVCLKPSGIRVPNVRMLSRRTKGENYRKMRDEEDKSNSWD